MSLSGAEVKMKHPTLGDDQDVVEVTRAAFDGCWADLGWEEIAESTQEDEPTPRRTRRSQQSEEG